MSSSIVPVFGVADVARTAAWYADALGFDVVPLAPSVDGAVRIVRDEASLVLRTGEPSAAEREEWRAYFRVTAVDALFDAVRAKAEVVSAPTDTAHHDRECELLDCDGRRIAFGEWEERRDDAVTLYGVAPVLHVDDVQRSLAWWRDALGFVVHPFPDVPPFRIAVCDKGPYEVILKHVDGAVEPTPAPGVWDAWVPLTQEGIGNLWERLRGGARVVRELGGEGALSFEVADADGHVLCFAGVA